MPTATVIPVTTTMPSEVVTVVPTATVAPTVTATPLPVDNTLRVRVIAADATDVLLAWFNINLDIGQTRSILSAVVLLLHQQIHFVEAVKCCSVFLGVMLKRLLQSKECDTALVLDGITHRGV
jgi:hypothetical protein